jgi:outer membrane protein assembly factor BamB
MLRRMLLRRIVIASCLLGAGACKDDPPPAAAVEETPEAKRQKACEQFATEMARTGLIAGQVLVTALSDDPARASEGREGMKSEARQLRRELLDKCMQWPDDVMACLPPLGILKDGCEEKLLAAMDGGKPAPEQVAAGPAPAWSTKLPAEPRHVAVTRDGTVLVVGEGLVGLRNGEIAWRKDGEFDGWLVELPGEPSTWTAGIEDRVVAFDPKDGSERWVATLPAVERDEDDVSPEDYVLPEGSDPEQDALGVLVRSKADVQIATRHGEGLLVGDAAARFFRVDPRHCAAEGTSATTPGPQAKAKPGAAACVTSDGQLPDEILESDARLFVGPSDERYLWETGILRAFAKGWRPLMTARAHDVLSHVTVADGRLVLIVDGDVVELEPTQCRGEATFAPSDWPQPGALVVREADECDECRTPPPGCRRWRAYVDDVTGEAPALLSDGTAVVHAEGYTLALHDGKPRWKVFTGGGGPLVTDGTRIFGFSTGLREGDAPGVLELAAADGTLRWRTVLPLEVGDVYFSDDIRLALAGAWLAVAYEDTVIAIPLPPA